MTRERIDAIAEIVAEIWRSGKNDSQVFDYHECIIRQRWVARLNELLRLPPKLELISHEEVQKARGYVLSNRRALRNIAQAQLDADQKAIEGVK